jgi:hypothetical protein
VSPQSYRRNLAALLIAACSLIALSAALVHAQTSNPARTFHPNAISNFRVELRTRIETELQKPTPVGAKTFLRPINTWVEQNLSWQTTRIVVSISPDGSAEIEERLSAFFKRVTSSDDVENKEELFTDLESALALWSAPKTLRYREARTGQISGINADAVPPVGESAPRVLTAWLLRALRPTAALPAHPLKFGDRWQEPRTVEFAEWTGTTGSESGEWLGNPAGIRQRGESTLKLQSTQEISGAVTSGTEKPAEGSAAAHFHAESLSTLALDDLRLMSAARSATRDIVWTLAPVEGLEKPPQYRGRLFVEISIQVCDENPCTGINGNSGGSR